MQRYTLLNDGKLILAKESIKRLKTKIKQTTKRNRGISLQKVIKELNKQLDGWIGYYRLTEYPGQLKDLDGWIRRKLRCYRLKQRKQGYSIAKFLIGLGAETKKAWSIAQSSKGWWCLAKSPALHQAMNNAWFKEMGLTNLLSRSILLNT